MTEANQARSLWDVVSMLPLHRAAVIAFVVADTICLGALTVYIFTPGAFAALSLPKLMLLAASLTVPVLSFGTIAFQIGVARRDYSKLADELDTSLVYSVFLHLMWILAALSVHGINTLFSVRPVPWLPVGGFALFWLFSGLYVLQMVSIGISRAHDRPWIKWIFVAVLIANAIAAVIYKTIYM